VRHRVDIAGAGSRVFRVAPPPTVDWYDIDFPDVITARQQLLPERAHAHVVGADLTGPDWLDAVPAGRLAAHSAALSRRGTTVLHYRF